MKDGDTISFTEDAPVYLLSHYIDKRYEQEDPFYNPGMEVRECFGKEIYLSKIGSVLKGWKNT